MATNTGSTGEFTVSAQIEGVLATTERLAKAIEELGEQIDSVLRPVEAIAGLSKESAPRQAHAPLVDRLVETGQRIADLIAEVNNIAQRVAL